MNEEEKERALQRLDELKNHMMELPYKDPMDENYKRIQYVRYADDCVPRRATKVCVSTQGSYAAQKMRVGLSQSLYR